jgi:hypothetical protein
MDRKRPIFSPFQVFWFWFGWLDKTLPPHTHFGVKLNGVDLQGNHMCKGTSTPAIASVKDRKYAIFQEKSNMYSYVSALAKPKLS